jgi:formylglycine-generating enzyme required for sulfatase activity
MRYHAYLQWVRMASRNFSRTALNATDGAEMVFVPAGYFTMGASEDQITSAYQASVAVVGGRIPRSEYEAEGPPHKVYLDGYWIYKTPVTVSQYKKFSVATGHAMPTAPEWGWKDSHPIVNVTWSDANAYAQWAGMRLPSEAQWEKAARGADARQYPWGNQWDETRLQSSRRAPSDAGSTAAVGSFPKGASPYGALDMAGNVWQWVEDWYGADYYKKSPERNPTGPESGSYRVMRGGSWRYGGPLSFMFRASDRSRQAPGGSTAITDPATGGLWKAHDEIGFRCVTTQ